MEIIELISIIFTVMGMTSAATWVIANKFHQLETRKLREEIKLKHLEIDKRKKDIENHLVKIKKLNLEVQHPKNTFSCFKEEETEVSKMQDIAEKNQIEFSPNSHQYKKQMNNK